MEWSAFAHKKGLTPLSIFKVLAHHDASFMSSAPFQDDHWNSFFDSEFTEFCKGFPLMQAFFFLSQLGVNVKMACSWPLIAAVYCKKIKMSRAQFTAEALNDLHHFFSTENLDEDQESWIGVSFQGEDFDSSDESESLYIFSVGKIRFILMLIC